MLRTQTMKKTLGTMVAITVVAISIGTLIMAKYATAGETVRDGRFIAYDNGTVLDTSTNLMWAAKDNGSYIDWPRANKYCENYRGGGYTDWRMPTQDELRGLYDRDKNYESDCGVDVHITTKLIHLSCCCPWALEARGVGESTNVDFRVRIPRFWIAEWRYMTAGPMLNPSVLPVRTVK
jgi:hypothetical protein